jgi:putative SOS response-associated peptidase YedK
MCGRYVGLLPPEAIARLFRVSGPLPDISPSWNVAPGQPAMVVRRHPESGERDLGVLAWGLVPHWTKDRKTARRPINARAETAVTSPMFRDAFARRRALVPAQAFYEWARREHGSRVPYAIARRDGETLALAGLWGGWRSPAAEVLRSFAIIVTAANATLATIHDRMPVIVEAGDWPLWLGEVEGDVGTLLRPAAENVLRVWLVGVRVNRPANNDADLLAPLAN